MKSYEVTLYNSDILISVDHNDGDGQKDVWIGAAMNSLIDFTEKFLCEENAKDVRRAVYILREFADDMEKKYESWKLKGFDK